MEIKGSMFKIIVATLFAGAAVAVNATSAKAYDPEGLACDLEEEEEGGNLLCREVCVGGPPRHIQ